MAFPVGWTRRTPITIPAAQVGSGGVTSFTVLSTEANVPSEIFSLAMSTGADVRVSTAIDGTGLLTLDAILFNVATSKIVFRVGTLSLSSVVDNTLYMWYGKTGESFQVGSGAYNSNWRVYYPFDDGTANDRTSYANHGTLGGSLSFPTDIVAGKVGSAVNFNGTTDRIDTTVSIPSSTPLTMMGWFKTSVSSVMVCSICDKDTPDDQHRLHRSGGDTVASTFDGVLSQAVDSSPVVTDATWFHAFGSFTDGSNRAASTNASAQGTDNNSRTAVGLDRFTVGVTGDSTPSTFMSGDLDEVQLHDVVRPAAWLTTEYNQTNAPGTFASAGTPVSVASSPVAKIYQQMAA